MYLYIIKQMLNFVTYDYHAFHNTLSFPRKMIHFFRYLKVLIHKFGYVRNADFYCYYFICDSKSPFPLL